MPSFDVVSKTDMQEVANAVAGAGREIGQRFDFKGSKSSLELKDKEQEVIILADDELKLKQVQELLRAYISRRKLEVSCLDFGKEEKASGNMVRQAVKIKQGIDQETAKKIVKNVKDSKMKVQCAIQGDEVRISGKKKDDLQDAIAFIKTLEIAQPLQFINFRD
ncbi:MAG: YajQ family cyclic di-GMP-binding protein [Alphaproteobacteria bacterium]|nr:YajQ family cyclic di-GMP-binding protein [Alphaproteobacteria bacterium]